MSREIQIDVRGISGVGKSTVATLISNYLHTIGFDNVELQLADNDLPPCPTDLRQRTASLQDAGTKIRISEWCTHP